jgi:glycine betaine/proline transport system ATP-binding protein
MSEQESMITCENVWKIFGDIPKNLGSIIKSIESSSLTKEEIQQKHGVTVGVHNASFRVRKGEVFVIMGLSGSGKSTLLRCINRLITPSSGRVFVGKQDVARMSGKELRKLCRERMGMVFQNFALVPKRTVLQNVTLGLEIQGLDREERLEKARGALKMVGLSGWESKYCHELSGGMQQRVGLARALAGDPEILLMDEAFSALDPLIRKQMQDEFLKLVGSLDKTIVFITHDLDEGLKLGDRIAVMKDGRIVQIGTPEEIVMTPSDDYVAEFVSAISRTRRDTARNVMIDPAGWTCSMDQDANQLLERMHREDKLGLLVTDPEERLRGALLRDDLREATANGETGVGSLQARLSSGYCLVDIDAPMDELVQKAAETRLPLVVLNRQRRVVGVVPRSSLLQDLSEMI